MDNGVYKGFSPTDESGVAMGEIHFTFTDETVAYKFATGLEVVEGESSRADLREMSTDEIGAYFDNLPFVEGLKGYTFGPDSLTFIVSPLTEEHPKAMQVIALRFVSDEIDALYGPTALFTPDQVDAGLFDLAIATIESDQRDPGVMPRIANGGRRG